MRATKYIRTAFPFHVVNSNTKKIDPALSDRMLRVDAAIADRYIKINGKHYRVAA